MNNTLKLIELKEKDKILQDQLYWFREMYDRAADYWQARLTPETKYFSEKIMTDLKNKLNKKNNELNNNGFKIHILEKKLGEK